MKLGAQGSDRDGKVDADHPFFDLIEDAYRVFATHKPRDVEVCVPHCMPQKVADDFFVPDIQDLPLRYLEEWYSAAAATEGVSKHLWTYLLPRILEVLASGKAPSFLGFEVALQRYIVGSEREWSNDQWAVLDAFQRRYLTREIAMEVEHPDCYFDDVLCMFRKGGWDLDGLLAQVMAAEPEQLVQRLWQDWCGELGEYGSIWITAFWEPTDEERVRSFYTNKDMHERFMGIALSDVQPKDVAHQASECVSVMEREAQ